MYLKKHKEYTMALLPGALVGGGFAFLWTIAASGILAWLIHSGRLPEETVGYGSMVILLTCSAIGSAMGYRKVRRQRLLICLCSGIAYMLMLVALTALFFGGQYTGIGVTMLLILGGSGTTALLGMGKGNRHVRSERKIRL